MNLIRTRRQASIFQLLSLVSRHLPPPAFFVLLVVVIVILSSAGPTLAQGTLPKDVIKGVRFEQKLNSPIPLELTFRNESGQPVQLAEYFGQKPVILVFAYYDCPMLCTLVLNGLLDSLEGLAFDVGNQFQVVTVSIDPDETPALAAEKKDVYLEFYGRPGADQGWHFLTGDQAAIEELTQAAGFYYQYDPEQDEYAHPTGIMIVTPEGKIARYLYGIKYPSRDVRLGLVEAAENQIGSPVDQILLTCYHYDPVVGKYNLAIMNIIRIAGLATVALMGAAVLMMLHRERQKIKSGI